MSTGKAGITRTSGMRVWTTFLSKTMSDSERKAKSQKNEVRKSVGCHDLGQGKRHHISQVEPNPRGENKESLKD